jgi:MFS family permease
MASSDQASERSSIRQVVAASFIGFGHFGDRIGRKTMLVLSLLIMGVATFLIGLLPTYAAIGIWAPVILVALRIAQGVGVGGEWGGAVLRRSPPTRRSCPGAGGCRSCSAPS